MTFQTTPPPSMSRNTPRKEKRRNRPYGFPYLIVDQWIVVFFVHKIHNTFLSLFVTYQNRTASKNGISCTYLIIVRNDCNIKKKTKKNSVLHKRFILFSVFRKCAKFLSDHVFSQSIFMADNWG